MEDPATTVVLVRHGESQAQVDGILSGHDTCTGLSALGRQQAELLRDRLAASGELVSAAAVYTSVLSRAIETAQLITPALPPHIAPQAECDWCEIHGGEAEGLTFDQARDRYPHFGVPDEPFAQRIPGAESWAEFYVRAGTRLHDLTQQHPGEQVVVICHGGIVGASFVALGDIPIRRATRLTRETANTSITEWHHADHEWRLVRYNDVAHLHRSSAESQL